ncbi:hypothetical protein [Sphingomonas sp.]|uniref:hypothetical protein n=1 Tax=Sphingomonas sp. TaxID=28214 RepID=UPI001B11BB2D|nr:hypothetical protein [Sphingomonas sp.]MBO9712043.1 hypothetical protein [Sphingomonas sp.]
MIGLAVYAGMLAYGRVAKSFGPLHWLVVAVIAIATTVLSAMMLNVESNGQVFLGTLLQFAILAAIYAAGVLGGRWLDRHKQVDELD